MKLNNSIITVGLISLNLLFTLPLPAPAQSNKQSSKCNATLQSVKNKITKGRKVSIVKFYKENISQEYQSYPQNRPFSYSFSLLNKGTDTDDFLVDNQILTSLSRDIITNCANVSQVIFGINGTDAVKTFGLMPGNKINKFKCLEPGPYQKLPWGYVFCV